MILVVYTRTPKAVDHDLLDETLDLTDASHGPWTAAGQVRTATT